MFKHAFSHSWLSKKKETVLWDITCVSVTVEKLWQEKACHLLGRDEAKSGFVFLVMYQRV